MANSTLQDIARNASRTDGEFVPPTNRQAPTDEPVIITDPTPRVEAADPAPTNTHVPVPIQPDPSMFMDPAAPTQQPTMNQAPPMMGRIDLNYLPSSLGTADKDAIRLRLDYYTEIHRNNIIRMTGLTPSEAHERATKDISRYLYGEIVANDTAITEEATEETPASDMVETAEIIIDKTVGGMADLALTDEEHARVEKVKRIRLVTIEDADLAMIKIERPDEKLKMDYIRSIEGSVSRYSVPLPLLGDFVDFRGAQISQMMNLIKPDDAQLEEVITAKASLIYDKLLRGSILTKFKPDGKIRMSYTEFVNVLPYQDLDMSIYGILCASSSDDSTTTMKCPKCKHSWDQAFTIKGLLNMDDAPDSFKERVDGILKHKFNDDQLKAMHDEARMVKRYRSPFSGHIFDLSYPTVARATAIFKRIDQKDAVMMYTAAIALYISRILIYNEERGSYIEVSCDDAGMLIDTMMNLSENDMQMIATQVQEELLYEPKFIFKSTCPQCGREAEDVIKIEHLIFLRAQDSKVEIDN